MQQVRQSATGPKGTPAPRVSCAERGDANLHQQAYGGRKMGKKTDAMIWILLTAVLITGCSSPAGIHSAQEPVSETVSAVHADSSQAIPTERELQQVIDRITQEYDLNNTEAYKNKIEDLSKDAIVLLCQSGSGKYKAYGFISPEYGQQGILIDHVINGESNWNYFNEWTWAYSDAAPTLTETGEYDVIFTFTQKSGLEQTVYFECYDTGTMAVKY